ncbi:hypothetical protein RF11_04711 [Thelohanellus kitauei]|uniref:Uncharacterized protein n=1 Tax=Thelohanellus kitauei TaxID=669202 RepID=A0A0C2J6B0_THEKT|nr:hypothetical protein RF11_04711 [Thelohanellus kitauei]
MFSRSSVNNEKFHKLAKAAKSDGMEFRTLHEVRWLSRHLAVTALVRNYNTLIDYFSEELNSRNYSISKYSWKRLRNPQFRMAGTAIHDILGELASMCKLFQTSILTLMEALQFFKVKTCKIRSQYLGERVYWSGALKESIDSDDQVIE